MRNQVKILISILLFLSISLPHTALAGGYGWGYKKNNDHEIPDVGKYKDMLDKYGAYYADFSGEKIFI